MTQGLPFPNPATTPGCAVCGFSLPDCQLFVYSEAVGKRVRFSESYAACVAMIRIHSNQEEEYVVFC